MNERQYLAKLESANTDELAELLRRATVEEERVLALYFGEQRLARLRGLARTRRRGAKRGNVVVLHGIMGGELALYSKTKPDHTIWLNFPRLIFGALKSLAVTPALTSQFDVRPTGILKKWYSEMLLGLAADQWNVQAFAYDWRLDLAQSADELREKIDGWFGPTAPVHLVAHSMGGLVSRTFILRHLDRWGKEGKLVMLGTPNHGSFAIPQVITGAFDTVRKLIVADITHNRAEVLAILNSMPGSMQMLPSPLVMPEMEKMYDATTWARYGVTDKLLNLARESHTRLQKIVDRERMFYIAGCNQITKVNVAGWDRLDDPDGYEDSFAGDGTVPHKLGFLFENGKRIPTYFVEALHGALPNNEDVIGGTQQLLATGGCSLPEQPPKPRAVMNIAMASVGKRARESGEEAQLRELSLRIQMQNRGTPGEEPPAISQDEIRAQELVVRNFVAESRAMRPAAQTLSTGEPPTPVSGRGEMPTIKVGLVHGGIERCSELVPDADAVSVGHYIGISPQYAEFALDLAISSKKGQRKSANSDLIITSLCRRGAIVGELGQNFVLPDPHQPKRAIVIAGMGQPGTFREPELVVLARELTWMLGRLGRKHLCTVLIGGGVGNIDVPNAIRAWMRGIRQALCDANAAHEPRLETVTFVEFYATNFLLIDRALKKAVQMFANYSEPLKIKYSELTHATIDRTTAKAVAIAKNMVPNEIRKRLEFDGEMERPHPNRLTIRLVRNSYEFAAVSDGAAVPQRDTPINPRRIDEANDLLPGANDHRTQSDKGNLLGRLLLPGDLRAAVIKPPVPLVLTLDRTTARIHWEMVALRAAASGERFDRENFLGTACGLTRQLRTTFAPLPEPPELSGSGLRVLVIADPAEDAPLPGALEEGKAVVRIFEQYKEKFKVDVEIVSLFGRDATPVAVLDQLINHRFDILHYAGHCFYDDADPSHCGWIFTGDQRITVDELNRIDRIPRFVFSNACESGVTPEDRHRRSALLAPSFAEAFFARGVGNFICTAWPVDDAAALAFAQQVYRGLLGMDGAPLPLCKAMAEGRAKLAIELGRGGLQTWGAYQHYGDPNFGIDRSEPAPASTATGSTPKVRRKKSPRRKTARRTN